MTWYLAKIARKRNGLGSSGYPRVGTTIIFLLLAGRPALSAQAPRVRPPADVALGAQYGSVLNKPRCCNADPKPAFGAFAGFAVGQTELLLDLWRHTIRHSHYVVSPAGPGDEPGFAGFIYNNVRYTRAEFVVNVNLSKNRITPYVGLGLGKLWERN